MKSYLLSCNRFEIKMKQECSDSFFSVSCLQGLERFSNNSHKVYKIYNKKLVIELIGPGQKTDESFPGFLGPVLPKLWVFMTIRLDFHIMTS